MIKQLDFELSSICNAGCPVCSRRQYGRFAPFDQTYWKLEDVKRVIGLDLLKQLDKIDVCGNFGDGMGSPEIVEIARWIKVNNPNCRFEIHTNGGIGSPEQYKALAELGVGMIFGIDGYGDKNELYRINAKWNKVYENFIAFSENKATPEQYFKIQFLLWDQTRDQIQPILNLAKNSTLTNILLLKPFTQYTEYTRGFNMKGEYTHSLSFTEDEIVNKLGTKDWAREDFRKLEELLKEINPIAHPLIIESEEDFLMTYHRRKDYVPRKPIFPQEEIDKLNRVTKQTCYSFNADSPGELTTEANNLYITYNGYLMPCCIIPPQFSIKLRHSTNDESPYQVEILNSVTKLGMENFSLKDRTIQEVYDTGILHKFVYDNFKNNTQFGICKTVCGKCE